MRIQFINKRLLLINGIFVFICFIVFLKAINTSKLIREDEFFKEIKDSFVTYFSNIDYFIKSNVGKKVQVSAKEIELIDDEFVSFVAPDGIIFDEKDNEINFYSKKGQYYRKKKFIELDGEVEIKYQNKTLTGDHLIIDLDKEEFIFTGNIKTLIISEKNKDKININSNKLVSGFDGKKFEFSEGVNAQLRRRRIYEEGFSLKSNKISVDLEQSKISLLGNVWFKRKNYQLTAQKGDIFLENYNKSLKYFIFYDDIRIEEKLTSRNGTPISRQAFAEILEGNLLERTIELSGSPRIIQGDHTLKGYRIILRENIEQVEIEESQSRFKLENKKKKKKSRR